MKSLLSVGLVGPLPPPSGGMANQTQQLAKLLTKEGLTVELSGQSKIVVTGKAISLSINASGQSVCDAVKFCTEKLCQIKIDHQW